MTAAWLLTGLAVLGIVIGSLLGQSRMLSLHFAAAGGGLLSGISLFWLIPEIAQSSGFFSAFSIPLSLAAGLWFADRKLLHVSHSHPLRHGFVMPLIAATGLHSTLDGWSIRAFDTQAVANVAVLLGLALHKLPEGLALGWITRNSLQSTRRSIAVCSSAELLTVVGAWIEPKVASSRLSFFGTSASIAVLMLVAGSFLFLGSHTVIADRKKRGIVPVFLSALLLAAALAWVRHAGQ